VINYLCKAANNWIKSRGTPASRWWFKVPLWVQLHVDHWIQPMQPCTGKRTSASQESPQTVVACISVGAGGGSSSLSRRQLSPSDPDGQKKGSKRSCSFGASLSPVATSFLSNPNILTVCLVYKISESSLSPNCSRQTSTRSQVLLHISVAASPARAIFLISVAPPDLQILNCFAF